MKHSLFVLSAAAVLALSACNRQQTPADPAVTAPTADAAAANASDATVAAPVAPATAEAAAPTATPESDDSATRAKKEAEAKLAYATMEDSYINDPKGQWAISAKASSSFGSANDEAADSQSGNTPWQATGAPNGDEWTNNSQDIGFDWLQTDYATPVSATEVRAVFSDNVEAVTKIELIDTAGTAHVVWTGVYDTPAETRGNRSWVVRKFEATPYQVKSVKVTVANPVARGYKKIDAVQLVGG